MFEIKLLSKPEKFKTLNVLDQTIPYVNKELKKFKILDKRFWFLRYSFRSRQMNCKVLK